MLQPHSFLWHYLWLGPHFLQAVLAVLMLRRGLHRTFPLFFAYIVFEAAEEFILYGMDILPSVSVRTWWLTFCAGLIIEGSLNLAVIGELVRRLLHSRPTIANISARIFTIAASGLVLLAVLAAAYAPVDRQQYVWSYRGYLLLQSFYLVEGGLALFLFLFVA